MPCRSFSALDLYDLLAMRELILPLNGRVNGQRNTIELAEAMREAGCMCQEERIDTEKIARLLTEKGKKRIEEKIMKQEKKMKKLKAVQRELSRKAGKKRKREE